ncbi:MAG: DNA cytosine methyltransferase [Microthrixaceae bacterium]
MAGCTKSGARVPQTTLAGSPPRTGEVEGARRLRVDETALLQSFPDSMHFEGRPSSQYRQIGNAVPPLLARQPGEALLLQR